MKLVNPPAVVYVDPELFKRNPGHSTQRPLTYEERLELQISLEMYAATDLELMQEEADRMFVQEAQMRQRHRLGNSIKLNEW